MFAIASFITGLVINSRSIDYMKRHLTYRMATYSENEDSIEIIDDIQTNWQCCGTNLWLDWSRYALGIPGVGTVGSGSERVVTEYMPRKICCLLQMLLVADGVRKGSNNQCRRCHHRSHHYAMPSGKNDK